MLQLAKARAKRAFDNAREVILSRAKTIGGGFSVALAFVLGPAIASAAPTLPATGVDVAGFVSAMIVDLGAVVAVVVGGYFAYLLIRKAMGWGNKTA